MTYPDKIAIVLREDLASWQQLNVAAFLPPSPSAFPKRTAGRSFLGTALPPPFGGTFFRRRGWPGTALTFLSEMGRNIFTFGQAKQFASWLRLTPNNGISGGRGLSRRTEKSRNRLAKALRGDAANALG